MKLYYFLMHVGTQKYLGVKNKMLGQIYALNQIGIESQIIWINIENNVKWWENNHILIERLSPLFELHKKYSLAKTMHTSIKNKVKNASKEDILYLRMMFPNRYLYKTLKLRRNCKIIIEHQTKENQEMYNNQGNYFKKSLYFISDKLYSRKIRLLSDGIVGVTPEITEYQLENYSLNNKPNLAIGNGFTVNSVPLRNVPHFWEEDIHILCVANLSFWHGLDRLLQGLAAYNCTPKVILHIAGDGSELPHLQKLTDELGIAERVVFHGFLTGDALDALFEQCHIAVGSLGIHRIGLKEASILKAREYCARGIPFVIAVSDPDFPPDYPYILHLPADESPIDIEKVLAFAEEVCADPDHPQKMRCYAEEHLDWSVKMKKLKDFLEGLVNEENGEQKLSGSD